VLVGVLASERYNAEVEAVCDEIRKRLVESAFGDHDGGCDEPMHRITWLHGQSPRSLFGP